MDSSLDKGHVVKFNPMPYAPSEVGGLKRMLMLLAPDRTGFVTDSRGVEYYVDKVGTVRRMTKKKGKTKYAT